MREYFQVWFRFRGKIQSIQSTVYGEHPNISILELQILQNQVFYKLVIIL